MLEKRFRRNPAYQEAYKAFMKEYLDLGHMELVDNTDTSSSPIVYIPHHFVLKEDSSTTKLRVVFDASMKSSSGVSLNDALMVGPTVQDELLSLLLRFRLNPVAIKADIAKMYRQFEVHPLDRDLQRILWREDINQPVKEYRLRTVTYGTGPASFLATRCLKQLALDEKSQFPTAADVLLNDTYVDDLISGASEPKQAGQLVNNLIELTALGGMDMRKWCSSHHDVMSLIPEELRESGSSLSFDSNSIKALGILWEPESDCFKFTCQDKQISLQRNLKKNELLGEIAKVFDPLGWISAVTIRAKLMFQALWKEKGLWTDLITDELQNEWNSYQEELQQISTLEIPRCITTAGSSTFELHGFSDASEKAYSAAIYLRCLSGSKVSCHLLMAKTKVAPLKQRSLPRLELCGALLLAETLSFAQSALKLPCSLHAWTDSMIVLHWLNSESRRWKTFVANRVADIQELIPPQHWKHIKSQENPADLPSRGITVEELLQSKLWWNGPAWLSYTNLPPTPAPSPVMSATVLEEERPIKQVTLTITTNDDHKLMQNLFDISSLEKIVTNVVWLRRYFNFLRFKSSSPVTTPILPAERRNAMLKIIILVQSMSFQADIISLRRNNQIPNGSNLLRLNPYLDGNGIMRVGGRLDKSAEKEGKVHPVILPKSHPFTTLLIRTHHHNCLHGGPSLVLSLLRRRYWIIGGRNLVRKVISDCITCKRIKATTAQQLMGSLPAPRVTPSKSFTHCGVDLAGPFSVKLRRGRGSVGEKCWIVIFICFSTKAVHIDAVLDLSTDTFLAAFRRFTSRRGIPSHMYSDCGTNFVGANKVLVEINQDKNQDIQKEISAIGTTWVFNPPAAPHHGGLWESAVKSASRGSLGTNS